MRCAMVLHFFSLNEVYKYLWVADNNDYTTIIDGCVHLFLAIQAHIGLYSKYNDSFVIKRAYVQMQATYTL